MPEGYWSRSTLFGFPHHQKDSVDLIFAFPRHCVVNIEEMKGETFFFLFCVKKWASKQAVWKNNLHVFFGGEIGMKSTGFKQTKRVKKRQLKSLFFLSRTKRYVITTEEHICSWQAQMLQRGSNPPRLVQAQKYSDDKFLAKFTFERAPSSSAGLGSVGRSESCKLEMFTVLGGPCSLLDHMGCSCLFSVRRLWCLSAFTLLQKGDGCSRMAGRSAGCLLS